MTEEGRLLERGEGTQEWFLDTDVHWLCAKDEVRCTLVVRPSWPAFIVSTGRVLLGCCLSCGLQVGSTLGCVWVSPVGWVCPQALLCVLAHRDVITSWHEWVHIVPARVIYICHHFGITAMIRPAGAAACYFDAFLAHIFSTSWIFFNILNISKWISK
jgi:hypothetical protein